MPPLAAHFVVAALAFAVTAMSQEVRVGHTGRVFDGEHKPTADAKVTLVSGSQYGDEGDVVSADSDAEGRFRAQLLPMRTYIAWATMARDDGARVSSAVEVGTAATDLVVGSEVVTTRYVVTGVEAWRAFAPLRLDLSVLDCPALTVRGEIDDAGTTELPPLPALRDVQVFVFARGMLVHVAGSLRSKSFALPTPRRLRVRVADDQGRVIAKATVSRCVSPPYREPTPFPTFPQGRPWPVATTADDGTAEILIAANEDPLTTGRPSLLFLATHPDHDPGLSGVTSQPFVNADLLDAKAIDRVLPFVLARPSAKPIQVIARDGQLPESLQRVGERSAPVSGASGVFVPTRESLPVREGVLRIAKRKEVSPSAIEIPCPDGLLPAGDHWLRSMGSLPIVLPATEVEKNGIDLRTALPLRLQVLDAGGGPAIGAHVLCGRTEGHFTPQLAQKARTDRSGRIVMPVIAGRWFVLAVLDDAEAHAIVEAAPGLEPQTLQLQPLPRMRVRIVDAQGAPSVGATFASSGALSRGDRTPEDQLLVYVGQHVTRWLVSRRTSDRDGCADLPFLTGRGTQFNVIAQRGTQRSPNTWLEANDDRIDIELR